MATLTWAERVWLGNGKREQRKASRKQIFELQTWRQVRGLQGAFVFETSDLAIKWPQWRFLLLDALVAVDMRVVCPKDVKNMLLKQSRMVGSKVRVSGAARRSVAGADPSFTVEGGWVQQRLRDIGWSDENKCQGYNKEEGTEAPEVTG